MTAMSLLTCDNEASPRGAGNTTEDSDPPIRSQRRRAGVSLPMEERWRPVVGFNGRYEVSDHGRVRNTRSGRLLKPTLSALGYGYVTISPTRNGPKGKKLVHRLVLTAFIREPLPSEMGRHLDDNPANNRVDNLAWGTQTDNMQDMVRHGRHANQVRTHCSKGHLFDENAVPYARKSGPRKGRISRQCRPCDLRKDPCPKCGKPIHRRGMTVHQAGSACQPTKREATA